MFPKPTIIFGEADCERGLLDFLLEEVLFVQEEDDGSVVDKWIMDMKGLLHTVLLTILNDLNRLGELVRKHSRVREPLVVANGVEQLQRLVHPILYIMRKLIRQADYLLYK